MVHFHGQDGIIRQEGTLDKVSFSPSVRRVGFTMSGLMGRSFEWDIPWATVIIGFLLLFSPMIDGGTTQLPVLLIRLVLFASAVVWLLGSMNGGTVTLLRDRLWMCVSLFVLWAALTVIWSDYKNVSVQWVLNIVSYAVLFTMVTQFVRSRSYMEGLVFLVIGMAIGEGLWGIAQYAWLGETRARGTFFNPNFFAIYEAAALLLAGAIILFPQRESGSTFKRWLAWGAVAVTVPAFVLAQSRGATAALAVALSVLLLCRFGRTAVVIISLCVAAGAILPNPLYQRVVNVGSQDPYAYTRFEIWKDATGRLIERPLGVGAGMYRYASFQERFPIEGNIVRYWKRPESAHNEYLQIGAELGIVGLLVFCVGVGLWLWEAKEVWRATSNSPERAWIVGPLAASLALVLHAGVDSTFHEPALVILLVLLGGFLHLAYIRTAPHVTEYWRVPFPYHPLKAVGITLGGLLVVGICAQSAAAWYVHEKGKQEARLGRVDAALTWYSHAASIDPGTTGYHDSIARTAMELYHESHNPTWLLTASEEESLAVQLNGWDGRFPYRLGTIYRLLASQRVPEEYRREWLQKAENAYQMAIQRDPYWPLSYFDLAQMAVADGNVKEAIALLHTAREYEPNFLPGRALLAELSITTGIPGNYKQEYTAIKNILALYERRELNDVERQFLSVDLYPLGRALAMGGLQ